MPPLADAVEKPPVVPPEKHMSTRALVFAGISVFILIVLFVFYIQARSPLSGGQDTGGTWGGVGGPSLFRNPFQTVSNDRPTTQQLLSDQVRDDTITLPTQDLFGDDPGYTQPTDFVSLLKNLTQQPVLPGEQGDSTGAYSFIPQGILSVSVSPKKRNPLQQSLFEYGNAVGSYVKGFEDSHQNMLHVLKDANEDRGDETKAAAAAQIGTDYIRLGSEIALINEIPASAKTLNTAFSDANKVVGRNMRAVANAKTDAEFLNAIDAYNASVEAYVTHFVALANLFGAAEVQFSASDPGSVFTFSNATPIF